jgi:hypothetical protein
MRSPNVLRALDGIFTEAADGMLRFHPAQRPTDADVARLVATICPQLLPTIACQLSPRSARRQPGRRLRVIDLELRSIDVGASR